VKFYSNSNNNIKSAPLYEVLSRQNKRENNEDSYQVFSLIPSNDRPPVYILAVADGMGGHAYGEEASEQTLRKLSLSLFESLTVNSSINFQPQQAPPLNRDRLSQTLQDAIRAANEHIRRIVQQNNWGVSGSTVVVAAILEDTAVVVNLGDSPLFHYQARNNRLTQVTEDHTVAGVLQRSGMITAEMARHHEGKSRLQFFVGCSHLPSDLPTYTLKLEPNDLLLLCSDGISGSLMPEDIANILASRQNLQEKAKSLVNKALDNKETDNQTLILWSHSPASSVSNSKNKSNNSSFIPSEEDETKAGINLFKLLVLPLIFIGSLAFGAYYFGFSFSRNSQSEITQEATNNQDQERENDAVETSVTEENSQQVSLNPPENQEQIIQNNYFSCDSDPQPPSSVSPNDKLKLYVRYDRKDEFDRVEQLLLTVCPRPDNDRTKKSFHKIPNELLFEVWFDRPSERENFKTKIDQEKRERGLLFVDVILTRENLESQDNI